MKITYSFATRQYEVCGNPEYETEEFEFEVDDTSNVIVNEFRCEFGLTLVQARELIDELDLWNELEERYEDEIKEHFEEEAYEMYKDQCEYESDPYSYYGVSRSDFI